MIPKNVVFIWTGSHATIPTGWERETTLDGIYAKATAAGVNPNVTGGSHTHSHTSPIHTHVNTHVHTGRSQDPDTSGGWSKDCGNDGTNGCQNYHYHNFSSDNPADGSLADAITYQSVNQEPPYRKVIFIKPTNNIGGLPDGVVALLGTSTLPNLWELCDGGVSRPDLRNRYLKGAAALADADVVTDFGSLTHTHVVDHTHSAVNHTHLGTTGSAIGDQRNSQSGTTINHYSHSHGFTLPAVSDTGGAYSGNVTSGDVEPSYKKLIAIQNTAGRTVGIVPGIIGMWLGTLATIPRGWRICDGNNGTIDMRGYHLKIANTVDEVGNVGGSNTHVHEASNSHNHSGTNHQHSVPTMSQNGWDVRNPSGNGFSAIQSNHLHNQGNGRVDAATSVYSSVTISADSANNEPAYRTVAFIQYAFSLGNMAQII